MESGGGGQRGGRNMGEIIGGEGGERGGGGLEGLTIARDVRPKGGVRRGEGNEGGNDDLVLEVLPCLKDR